MGRIRLVVGFVGLLAGLLVFPALASGQAIYSINPTSHDFGQTEVNNQPGYQGKSQTFTITETFGDPLNISSVSIIGNDAADFSTDFATSNCKLQVPPAGSCSFEVTFKPVVKTPETGNQRTAKLHITSNTVASPVDYILTGLPRYSFFVAGGEQEFGDVKVGKTSPVQTITLQSVGTGDILGFNTPDSQFDVVSQNCVGVSFQPFGTCDVGVTFTPAAAGLVDSFFNAELVWHDQDVYVGGTGVLPAGNLTPASQDFGSVEVGSTSGLPEKTFKVGSTATVPLTVTSASLTGTEAGAFRLVSATACNGDQAPESSCDLTVVFDPKTGAAGARNAKLSVVTDAGTFESDISGTATVTPVTPITPPPPPLVKELSLKLKAPKKVKRGKKLTVTINAKSIGTAAPGSVVIRTAVTGAVKKKVANIKWTAAEATSSLSRKIKIPVKKKVKAGKKFTVKVKAVSDGKTLATTKVIAKIKK